MTFFTTILVQHTMAEIALIALLSAGGSFGSAGICYCLKKHSELEKVRFRCSYEDESCLMGFIHENTQLQQKIEEEHKRLTDEKKMEIEHIRQLYDKDIELLDKDNQLKIANLELSVRKKDDEILHLNSLVEDIRGNYIRFKEKTNDMIFHDLIHQSKHHDGPGVQDMTIQPYDRSILTTSSIYSPSLSNTRRLDN